jgi:hypothetical protein
MVPLLLWLATGGFLPIFTPNQYFVSTTGSDVTGSGSGNAPWASVGHGCAALGALGATQDATINVEPGTYLGVGGAPWTVGTACSGASGHPLTIAAQNGINTAYLIGGQQLDVSTCAVFSGSVYRCTVPNTANFWTVYEGSARLQLARTPDVTFTSSFPVAQEPGFNMTDGSYTTIVYNPSDFDPVALGWFASDLEVFHWEGGGVTTGHIQWFSGINPVTALNTSTHTLTFANNFKYAAGTGGNEYIMEGDLQMVTVAGEWMLDRNKNHGTPPAGKLYFFFIPTHTPVSGETIYYPTALDALSVVGTDDAHPVHDVVIKNLDVSVSDFISDYRYATWGTGANGDYDPAVCIYGPNDCGMAFEAAQPAAQHGLVRVTSAHDITFSRDHIHLSGLAGMYLQNMAYNITVQDSWIEHTGYDGIQAEGRWCGQGDVNNNDLISDDKITNPGETIGHGAGVRLANSGSNTLTHLALSQGPRDAIYVTDLEKPGQFDGYAINNLIEFSSISHFGQWSADMGCLGFFALGSEPPTSPPYRTNTSTQMAIDHCDTHPTIAAFDAAAAGVFTDNQTHGQDFNFINATAGGAGGNLRLNDSGDHTYVDCVWQVGFDPSLMSPAIGLTAAFPY